MYTSVIYLHESLKQDMIPSVFNSTTPLNSQTFKSPPFDSGFSPEILPGTKTGNVSSSSFRPCEDNFWELNQCFLTNPSIACIHIQDRTFNKCLSFRNFVNGFERLQSSIPGTAIQPCSQHYIYHLGNIYSLN